jgi:hypothetical protein
VNEPVRGGRSPLQPLSGYGQQTGANLADILERVLDKGIVIVGDIKINLLDIELLTVKIRLLVASVDKAKEMGIDWWERDPALSSRAEQRPGLEEENERLRAEVRELRARTESPPAELPPREVKEHSRARRPEHEPQTKPRRTRRKPTDEDDTS